MKKKFVIIGASAAGIGTVQKLRQLAPEADITLVAAQDSLPYNTCHIADYLNGSKELAEVYTRGLDYFKEHKIELLLGECVMHIDSALQQVITSKRTMPYDALLIATGARPLQPFQIPALSNLFTFHTLSDAQALLAYAHSNPGARAIVVGAGLSGLEAADALHKQGLAVTIVERSSTVMPNLVNHAGAEFLHNRIRSLGIRLILADDVIQIHHDGEQAQSISLRSGEQLQADCFVVAVGVRPTIELAQPSNIACDAYGIITNEHMQTSQENIFAAGDCVSTHHQVTKQRMRSCLWPDAMMQGLIAAHGMAGLVKAYPGALPIISTSFFGVPFFSYGIDTLQDSIIREHNADDFYHAYLVDQDQRLQGYLLIGNTAIQSRLRRALLLNEII